LLEIIKNLSAGKSCPELSKQIRWFQASEGDVKTLFRPGAGCEVVEWEAAV